jgi:hypothetical protein
MFENLDPINCLKNYFNTSIVVPAGLKYFLDDNKFFNSIEMAADVGSGGSQILLTVKANYFQNIK